MIKKYSDPKTVYLGLCKYKNCDKMHPLPHPNQGKLGVRRGKDTGNIEEYLFKYFRCKPNN